MAITLLKRERRSRVDDNAVILLKWGDIAS